MRRRWQVVAITAAGALPFVVGLVLDNYIDPVYVWGGYVCGDGGSIDPGCQVPPYPLFTAFSFLVAYVGHKVGWNPTPPNKRLNGGNG